MKKSITKLDVVKALVNEPTLKRRSWFHIEPSRSTPKKNCSVCAVGSVLRAMSFEKWGRKIKLNLNELGTCAVKTDDITDQDAEFIPEHLKDKNYLAALSCYFESGKSRLQCIQFVISKFPEILTVEVDEDSL